MEYPHAIPVGGICTYQDVCECLWSMNSQVFFFFNTWLGRRREEEEEEGLQPPPPSSPPSDGTPPCPPSTPSCSVTLWGVLSKSEMFHEDVFCPSALKVFLFFSSSFLCDATCSAVFLSVFRRTNWNDRFPRSFATDDRPNPENKTENIYVCFSMLQYFYTFAKTHFTADPKYYYIIDT